MTNQENTMVRKDITPTATQTGDRTSPAAKPVSFCIRKMPSIPKVGLNQGWFSNAVIEAKAGQKHGVLTVSVELDATDEAGKRIALAKKYNLDGQGATGFSKDIENWRGHALTDDEFNDFTPDAVIVGRPVLVNVAHRKVGTKTVAQIEEFLPSTAAKPVVEPTAEAANQ